MGVSPIWVVKELSEDVGISLAQDTGETPVVRLRGYEFQRGFSFSFRVFLPSRLRENPISRRTADAAPVHRCHRWLKIPLLRKCANQRQAVWLQCRQVRVRRRLATRVVLEKLTGGRARGSPCFWPGQDL